MTRVRQSFMSPGESLTGFDPDALARIASAAGDIALVVARDGFIVDVSFAAGDPLGGGRDDWIDKAWIETVTEDSRAKIAEMLDDAMAGKAARWREVNHATADGIVAIRYLAVSAGDAANVLVIGTDLRASAALQQRLIQTQQSLERDYVKLRQAEARYRLLFDLDSDAVVIVDAETRRIREANPAATRLVGAKAGTLVGRPVTALLSSEDHERLIAYLGSAAVSDAIDPLAITPAGSGAGPGAGLASASLTATAFRQDRATFLLVRIVNAASGAGAPVSAMLIDAIAALPDAVVLTDADLRIVYVNASFLDLAQETTASRVIASNLGDYLGRAGIDLDLLVEQVRLHGAARNVATIVRGRGGIVEDVEVSAVAAPGEQGDGLAFSIRPVARREIAVKPTRDAPRSVEQLTELVGKMSLKDIVRESTDLIERLCIEAALEYTSDNRASAAEILGVSRQSLYSKLHRHGLGNLVSEPE